MAQVVLLVFVVLLGADVGITIMVILIALRLETYAPVMVLAGVVRLVAALAPLLTGVLIPPRPKSARRNE